MKSVHSRARKSVRAKARRVAAAAVASGLIAGGALTLATTAASASTLNHSATSYSFQTIDNPRDLTFNQLLGINDVGEIAGYFGSGNPGHPNQGYVIPPFSGSFVKENFHGSVQTQVTGLNNRGITVGFWSNTDLGGGKDANYGFVDVNGHMRTADFPTSTPASPPVDQLLGVNDSDVAVGFYTDASMNNHGYEYNIGHNRYSPVVDPNAPSASLSAAAINDLSDVAGDYTNPANGNTDGFLLTHHGQFIDLAVPGAASTMALGVNNLDEVVGVYTVGSGSSALMHGFTWTAKSGFRTVDDPHGIGTTTVNGVNDRGQLVGFYTVDNNAITDGFLATP
jgi:hypothetical protein